MEWKGYVEVVVPVDDFIPDTLNLREDLFDCSAVNHTPLLPLIRRILDKLALVKRVCGSFMGLILGSFYSDVRCYSRERRRESVVHY